MRIHNPPGSMSDLRSDMLKLAADWVRRSGYLEESGDQPPRGQVVSRATILRDCGIALRDLLDKYAHYVEDAPNDGLMVTVCDQTGKQPPATMHVPEGDYGLVCCEPGHVANTQVHGMAGETHVITVHRGSLCKCETTA